MFLYIFYDIQIEGLKEDFDTRGVFAANGELAFFVALSYISVSSQAEHL